MGGKSGGRERGRKKEKERERRRRKEEKSIRERERMQVSEGGREGGTATHVLYFELYTQETTVKIHKVNYYYHDIVMYVVNY